MRDDGGRGGGKSAHDAVFHFALLGFDDVFSSDEGFFLSFFVCQCGTVGLDDAFQSSYETATSLDALGDGSFSVGEVLE